MGGLSNIPHLIIAAYVFEAHLIDSSFFLVSYEHECDSSHDYRYKQLERRYGRLNGNVPSFDSILVISFLFSLASRK